jgi:hypothetical protein
LGSLNSEARASAERYIPYFPSSRELVMATKKPRDPRNKKYKDIMVIFLVHLVLSVVGFERFILHGILSRSLLNIPVVAVHNRCR